MTGKSIRVAVGLSGGVDSSVAAAILKEEGYDVIGLSMEIFDGPAGTEQTERHACYGPNEKEDIERAAAVCKMLDIPFHAIDLKKEYSDHVIKYFRDEYLAGRTPNPCIVCNSRLKFGFLLEKARESGLDFDLFATGHYARVEKSGGRPVLKKALDVSKDQSYFLYALSPLQLSRTLFPIGPYKKDQVREMARSFGLETADHPESQDFMACGDYSFLFEKKEINAGDIVDEQDHILGRHRGIIHYTVGQRRGLGVSSRRPLYVRTIDAERNRIVVGPRENLFSKDLIATGLNFIATERLDRPYRVKARIRLKHKEAAAMIFPHENEKVRVQFEEPQLSVTPGQSVVFYSGDIVLGGGIIEKAL
ncbi:MAG: tRNA 2-thiouridine(34) synthase MnmA [Desulfobacterales bacterium]|nr:tRNA 2-thiouridine(34) synthase MnmA [Desulfobacterales bacterium]